MLKIKVVVPLSKISVDESGRHHEEPSGVLLIISCLTKVMVTQIWFLCDNSKASSYPFLSMHVLIQL